MIPAVGSGKQPAAAIRKPKGLVGDGSRTIRLEMSAHILGALEHSASATGDLRFVLFHCPLHHVLHHRNPRSSASLARDISPAKPASTLLKIFGDPKQQSGRHRARLSTQRTRGQPRGLERFWDRRPRVPCLSLSFARIKQEPTGRLSCGGAICYEMRALLLSHGCCRGLRL